MYYSSISCHPSLEPDDRRLAIELKNEGVGIDDDAIRAMFPA
jgi:hypothetical protein